jgi:hypothetical protein
VPLAFSREGGSEVEVRSQYTGLAVLVEALPQAGPNFSVKEKDEASPGERFSQVSLNLSLHSPIDGV